MKTSPLAFLLALGLAGLSLPATATSAPSPLQRLQEAINQVTALAVKAQSSSQLAEDVRPFLEKYLSFEKMTQRAIGPGWRQFSAAQQAEAVNLFTTLIIRKYTDKYTLGEKAITEYRSPQELQKNRVEIPTRMHYRGSKYEVIYRMEDLLGWQVTDIVVEGVSFVANYRAQFESQFQKGGVPAVLQSLRTSVKSLP